MLKGLSTDIRCYTMVLVQVDPYFTSYAIYLLSTVVLTSCLFFCVVCIDSAEGAAAFHSGIRDSSGLR